jgi:TM2 domain-containing membrane protein YozV/predicted nucleic acid-binding Zn ribbon protein
MPIDITCNDCQESYKVPDNVAGKKIRCPKCNLAVIRVPDAVGVAATGSGLDVAGNSTHGAAAGSTVGADPFQTSETWQLKTENGDTYGPVDKPELDQWVAEGRVNSRTQLLRSGDSQWQWASIVYPHLAGQQAVSTPVVSHGQPYQHQYVNQQAAYATPQAGGYVGQKSKVVAGILAILIGSLGIHNFYLGYTGRAVTQLLLSVVGGILTCGISTSAVSIWAIIEGILILTGSIDRDGDGYLLKD